MELVARNVQVDGGEIDLLMIDGRDKVAVEVRSTMSAHDPVDAAPESKRRHVARLGRRLGATRIDVVGVRMDRSGVTIHWVPAAS